ncbi:MAG: PKD domain-containing protein [Bacteroidales bacterium]|nr:PKD domain-containing protein [Bacteroidales bacterium]
MQRKNSFLLIALLSLAFMVQGQSITKKALFLGNSYTAVNDLPLMTSQVANSAGDTLIYDSNAPGGYTFMGHSTNAASLTKIAIGNWDFVVLQEQSQYPSFPPSQVETEVFPYARALDSIINSQNACAETVFYMTWGRKNGDAQNCPYWPPVCTYEGMDSLLNLRYRMMAEDNEAILSPVGAVWNYIRKNHPSIELYQADESHPSVAGTYAGACCFYTAFFRKDPTLITFNAGLTKEDADIIKNAVKTILFDNLAEWHIGEYNPVADFSFTDMGSGNINFTNKSLYASSYFWDFGDSNTSIVENPTHIYAAEGTYTVKLSVNKCNVSDSTDKSITISFLNIEEQNLPYLSLYPNPTSSSFTLTVDKKYLGSTYTIFNTEGKIVLTGNINDTESIININKFSTGIYIIKIEGALNQRLKIIKE